MADVYLSYAREDLATARLIALALEQEGFSLSWDNEGSADAADQTSNKQQIRRAKVMLVLWSAASVRAKSVAYEAALGQQQQSIIPVSLDASLSPSPFEYLHTLKLEDWNGDRSSSAWKSIVLAVKHKMAEAELLRPSQKEINQKLPTGGIPNRSAWRIAAFAVSALALVAVVVAAIAGKLALLASNPVGVYFAVAGFAILTFRLGMATGVIKWQPTSRKHAIAVIVLGFFLLGILALVLLAHSSIFANPFLPALAVATLVGAFIYLIQSERLSIAGAAASPFLLASVLAVDVMPTSEISIAIPNFIFSGLVFWAASYESTGRRLQWFLRRAIAVGVPVSVLLYGMSQVALMEAHPEPPQKTHDHGDLSPGQMDLSLTADSDGAARIWRLAKPIAKVGGHNGSLVEAAFVDGGKAVLTIDTQGTARLTVLRRQPQMTVPESYFERLKSRLWEPFGAPVCNIALQLVSQVLTLEIPQHVKGARGPSFKDCQTCPEMVLLEPGTYLAGSSMMQFNSLDEERALKTIPNRIAVARFEVTMTQWNAAQQDPEWQKITGIAPDPKKSFDPNLPVSQVSWAQASAYVKWLSNKTGETYRLLNEAEWEYAARAGTTTAYAWGESRAEGAAAFKSSWASDPGSPVPVGSFPANGFGLHDMHGNVAEWVSDCALGQLSADPSCMHMTRGGSANEEWWYARSSARSPPPKTEARPLNEFRYVGFRVARQIN